MGKLAADEERKERNLMPIKWKRTPWILIALLCGLIAAYLAPAPAFAAEKGEVERTDNIEGEELAHFVVRVRGNEGLLPKRASVKKGTTVIWLNQTGDYIEIAFTGDQKVDVACRAPVHFILGADGTYISDKIPFGAVASLCFVEKGTYHYTAVATSMYKGGGLFTRERLMGAIIVE